MDEGILLAFASQNSGRATCFCVEPQLDFSTD